MSRLKRLISEIHHRSLWQVLLIYVGGALAAYQVVQAMTEGLGLTQRFPAFAVALRGLLVRPPPPALGLIGCERKVAT